MEQPDLTPYSDPESHEAISDIIRRHSSNPEDLRFATFRELELGNIEEVLDLGCGFGFMAEEIAQRISSKGRVTGMDACPGNEEIFLGKVSRHGRRARFQLSEIGAKLPWPDDSFDLSVCSFSLYFFDQIIPEVARVLKPGGTFIVLTHSEHSFQGLLSALGLPTENSPLLALLKRFSAENGRFLLTPCFAEITRIDYSNCLTFSPNDVTDLIAYLRFKVPLIAPGVNCEEKFIWNFEGKLWDFVTNRESVIVEKDDAIFICRRPK